jgi:hypothetical protein
VQLYVNYKYSVKNGKKKKIDRNDSFQRKCTNIFLHIEKISEKKLMYSFLIMSIIQGSRKVGSFLQSKKTHVNYFMSTFFFNLFYYCFSSICENDFIVEQVISIVYNLLLYFLSIYEFRTRCIRISFRFSSY